MPECSDEYTVPLAFVANPLLSRSGGELNLWVRTRGVEESCQTVQTTLVLVGCSEVLDALRGHSPCFHRLKTAIVWDAGLIHGRAFRGNQGVPLSFNLIESLLLILRHDVFHDRKDQLTPWTPDMVYVQPFHYLFFQYGLGRAGTNRDPLALAPPGVLMVSSSSIRNGVVDLSPWRRCLLVMITSP